MVSIVQPLSFHTCTSQGGGRKPHPHGHNALNIQHTIQHPLRSYISSPGPSPAEPALQPHPPLRTRDLQGPPASLRKHFPLGARSVADPYFRLASRAWASMDQFAMTWRASDLKWSFSFGAKDSHRATLSGNPETSRTRDPVP